MRQHDGRSSKSWMGVGLIALCFGSAWASDTPKTPEVIVGWLRDFQQSDWWYADSAHRHATDAIFEGGLAIQSLTWGASGYPCVVDFTTVEGLVWPGYHVRLDLGLPTQVLKSDLVHDSADSETMRSYKIGAGAPNYYAAVEGACVTEVSRKGGSPKLCPKVKLIVERNTEVERDRVYAALVDLTTACKARGRSTVSPSLY